MKTIFNNFGTILLLIIAWSYGLFAQNDSNHSGRSYLDTSFNADSSMHFDEKQLYARGYLGFNATSIGGGVSYGLGLNYCQKKYVFSGIYEVSLDLSSLFSSPNPYNMTFGLLVGKRLLGGEDFESNFLVGLGIEHVVTHGTLIRTGMFGNTYDTISTYTIAVPIQIDFNVQLNFIGIGLLSSFNINMTRPYCAIMLYVKIGKL
jgi:hypothetical protein